MERSELLRCHAWATHHRCEYMASCTSELLYGSLPFLLLQPFGRPALTLKPMALSVSVVNGYEKEPANRCLFSYQLVGSLAGSLSMDHACHGGAANAHMVYLAWMHCHCRHETGPASETPVPFRQLVCLQCACICRRPIPGCDSPACSRTPLS